MGSGLHSLPEGTSNPKALSWLTKDLHLTIRVLTADAALDVEENLNPVPGGASATDGWTIYLPSAGPLDSALRLP